jgi:hypothetical protein
MSAPVASLAVEATRRAARTGLNGVVGDPIAEAHALSGLLHIFTTEAALAGVTPFVRADAIARALALAIDQIAAPATDAADAAAHAALKGAFELAEAQLKNLRLLRRLRAADAALKGV